MISVVFSNSEYSLMIKREILLFFGCAVTNYLKRFYSFRSNCKFLFVFTDFGKKDTPKNICFLDMGSYYVAVSRPYTETALCKMYSITLFPLQNELAVLQLLQTGI